MIKLYDIVYVISSFFEMIIVSQLANVLFKKYERNNTLYVIGCIAYFILTGVLYLIIDIPILNLMCTIAPMFLIFCSYRNTKVHKVILSVVFIIVILMFLDAATKYLTGYMASSVVKAGYYEGAAGLLVQRFLLMLVWLIMRNIFKSYNDATVPIQTWLISIGIPVLSIFVSVVIMSLNYEHDVLAFICVIIIFVIDILVFYLYNSLEMSYEAKHEKAMLEMEKNSYAEQLSIMKSQNEEMSKYRHDTKNWFILIGQLIKKHNYNRISEICDSYQEKLDETDSYSATGNLVIDSLVNYKLNSAVKKGIAVMADINCPTDINIDTPTFTSLLGNLLDNAIEAAEQADTKNLMISSSYSKGRLFLNVQNTYNGLIIKQKNRFLSTKKSPQKHGIGLKSVNDAVKKYHGDIQIDYDDNLFEVKIMILV